jgi:RHS repeat-associated protein
VWDSETQLYYCSQRYYDPACAAFISKDPIKADGELAAYAYCLGEPVGSVDPSGLIPGMIWQNSKATQYYRDKQQQIRLQTAQANSDALNGPIHSLIPIQMSTKTREVYYLCTLCGNIVNRDGVVIGQADLSSSSCHAGEQSYIAKGSRPPGANEGSRWIPVTIAGVTTIVIIGGEYLLGTIATAGIGSQSSAVKDTFDAIMEWMGPTAPPVINDAGDWMVRNLENTKKIMYHFNNYYPHPEGPHLQIEIWNEIMGKWDKFRIFTE